MNCFGVWATVGSTGAWPQTVNMWELNGWKALAANFEHGNDDFVTDHDALVGTSSEHEHGVLPPWGRRGGQNGAYEVGIPISRIADASEISQPATASGARTL